MIAEGRRHTTPGSVEEACYRSQIGSKRSEFIRCVEQMFLVDANVVNVPTRLLLKSCMTTVGDRLIERLEIFESRLWFLVVSGRDEMVKEPLMSCAPGIRLFCP